MIDEIKDENTRRSLQVLPFEFTFKQPHAESVKYGKHYEISCMFRMDR